MYVIWIISIYFSRWLRDTIISQFNQLIWFDLNLIWFEFIHSCDINLNSTHEKLYAIYIEWTKLFEKENHSSTIQWLQRRWDSEF